MLVYNTTSLVPNLSALYELLQNKENESLHTCKCVYKDRIAIKHYTHYCHNIILIWRTKSLFDWWYDPYCSRNFIAILDYKLNDTYIKINHIGINDNERKNMYNNYLDEYDSEELIQNLINFLKIIATKEGKEKIIIDVHENLRLFLKYYYDIGFTPTKRLCADNPFWVEAEFIMENNGENNGKNNEKK